MKNISILFLLFLLMAACNRKQSQSEQQVSQSFQAERDVFFNSLKTPEDLAAVMLPEALPYNNAILHNPALYSKYLVNNVKAAANMGIYIADLNYNLVLGRKDGNKEYFTAAHELSRAIGIEQGILQFLSMRYSENIEQNDSLKMVVKELLAQSTKTLQGTDRERLAGIAMAAYQIENLHLILSGMESIPQNGTEEQQKVYQQLSEYVIAYRTNVEVSYNFIHSYADPADIQNNPNYPYFDNALRELILAYRALEGNTLSLQAVAELKNLVEPIRAKIVE